MARRVQTCEFKNRMVRLGGDNTIARPNRPQALFYHVVLPVLATTNLLLGVGMLISLTNAQWQQVLVVVTGAFCCVVAGWLLASGWSKAYWSRAIERQIDHWRQLADVLFQWLEVTPVPLESLRTLRGSLDEVGADRG